MIEYWEFYDEDDENAMVKKRNRRAKRDKIDKSKELFMKMNGRGLITDVLPNLGKKKKEK